MSGPAGLTITALIAEQLLEHARRDLPNEACGLLSGDFGAGRATRYHPARNGHASPFRYEVDPEDLVRIVFSIESADEDLVAIFHSHTGTAPVPSPADLRESAYRVVQLLASGSELRAWRIGSGACVEVPLLIEPVSSPRSSPASSSWTAGRP